MKETWATFAEQGSLDLHVDVGGGRVRASLERSLRDAVRSGRLRPGIRVPSSRTLARDLGVARNTIAEAYAQLVAEGWLTAVGGSGTRVTDQALPAPSVAPTPADLPPSIRYDLRPGMPDLSAFPRDAWARSARRALSAARSQSFGYGDPLGHPELRAGIAEYVSRARGVRATPDGIVICAGYTQGLAMLGHVLAGRGVSTAAFEAYGLDQHRDVVAAAGIRIAPIPVDRHGAVVSELGADVGVAVLTPAHQFPLGVPLAPGRRTAAVSWAAHTGGLVVEDDYDGEFRYDRQSIGAMQALAPEYVVYAGTASKSLAPGLRLAWLHVPAGLRADVIAARRIFPPSGVLDQLTFAQLLASGDYDRHVRRSRLAYRRRREHLVSALERSVPAVRVTGVAAGLHAIVELAPGDDEPSAIARCEARGLAVDSLSRFAAGAPDRPPALVVGFATAASQAYTGAIARLCAALADRRRRVPGGDRPGF